MSDETKTFSATAVFAVLLRKFVSRGMYWEWLDIVRAFFPDTEPADTHKGIEATQQEIYKQIPAAMPYIIANPYPGDESESDAKREAWVAQLNARFPTGITLRIHALKTEA